jgi:hypothetical protein
MDNAKFIQSMGLVDKIRPQDEIYLKEMIKLFFGHVTPSSLYIRKTASTSFPYFTSDIQYKKLGALKCLKNADHFLKCMTGDRRSLEVGLQDYHSLHVYATNERLQPDSVSKTASGYQAKERFAATPEQSRSGEVGTMKIDSTAYDDQGQPMEGHFAMRRRVVWGFSGLPNYFLTAILGCHRAVYLKRYAATYKTRGPEDKEQKIQKYKYIVGSDVKSMDTTVPAWFFEFFLNEMTNYWEEPLVNLVDKMFKASFVTPPPSKHTPDDYNPVFGDDPLDGTSDLSVGLPSGIAINPDIGKLWMSFVYIILMRDSGAIKHVSEVDDFLSGKNPEHGMLNMSDDATLMTNSATVRDKLMEASSPYAVLQPEVPVIFLGDVFTERNGEKRAFPNPQTFIVNAIARESSIQIMDPIAYAEGYLARYQLYSRTPMFAEINEAFEEEMRREFGISPYSIAKRVARMQKFDTDIDAMVKADVSVLYYKVDPADVSPEVLDEVVATVPAADFFNDIRHLFKVQTVPHNELT